MTRAEMLAELRKVLDDEVTTNLAWTDATLLGYLAEGQDKFCEETGYFVDKTNFSITLIAGTRIYDIPARVIQILEVWDGTRKLEKLDTGEVFGGSIENGDPSEWTTDQETGSIEFDRAPSTDEAGDKFVLRVWRYSLYPLDRISSTITLAGTLHAGDVITATVNDVAYSYTVLGTEGTLSAVATALAAVIDAATDLVSTASGQVISIASAEYDTSTTTTVAVTGAGATVTATAADSYSAAPEIPSRFHRACIEWAAFKALSHHDMDYQDKGKAGDHLGAFKMYINDGHAFFRKYHNIETRVGTDPAYRT